MIKLSEKTKNSEIYINAVKIIEILSDAGFESYIVGGAVRDLLIEKNPKEYDICTSATPNEINKIFKNSKLVGQSFGVSIVLQDKYAFEIATFREDFDYLDGRHPDKVKYTKNVEHDVKRRDFTVNGLLFDPIANKIIDYCDGLLDLKNKIIRTIGDPFERFSEDYLRILRAIRFSNQLNFEIEKKTSIAMDELSHKVVNISIERVRDEISKILLSLSPAKGIRLLDKYHILNTFIPEILEMKNIQQPPDFHPEGDVFVHTCLVLDKLSESTSENSIEVVYGALFHDIGKPDTYDKTDRIRFNRHEYVGANKAEKICKRLKFSNKQTELIVSLVKEHMKFGNIKNMKKSTFKKFVSMENFNDHLKLHKADCLGSHGDLSLYDFTLQKLDQLNNEPILPKPLLNGNDLIDLGIKPGPIYKSILSKIFDDQLEGNIKSRDEALIKLKEVIKND
tara:strand:+ start:1651 stop:3003 length:1353 start_codon:yes stop_codon:yes gene_type:complete